MSILDNEGHDPLGFGNVPPLRTESVEVFYTYSPAQQEARAEIIKRIEAEKTAYLERVEPLLRLLGNIQGTPHVVVRTAPR